MDAAGLPATNVVPPQEIGSALDTIDTLEKFRSKQNEGKVAESVYGQGPRLLKYSVQKQFLLFAVIAVWTFVPLTLTFLCLYRGFCFAEELTGNGNGDGGARIVYSVEASRAVVPVGLILALVLAPLTALAAHVQVLIVGVIAFALNAIACALLVIAAIGSFGFLATIPALTATRWSQLAGELQQRTYKGNAANLQAEMNADVAAVGVAALTGAVLTAVALLVQYPLLHAQLAVYLSASMETPAPGVTPARRHARLRRICCSVHPLSTLHDAAYGQGDAGSKIMGWLRSKLPWLFGLPSAPSAPPSGLWGALCANLGRVLSPITRVLSMPTAQARASFLTFVASTCGRPGLVLVSLCLSNTDGDRDLLQRAASSRSTLAQAAAGSGTTAGASANAAGGSAGMPAGAMNGSARPLPQTGVGAGVGLPQGAGVGVDGTGTVSGSMAGGSAGPGVDGQGQGQGQGQTGPIAMTTLSGVPLGPGQAAGAIHMGN